MAKVLMEKLNKHVMMSVKKQSWWKRAMGAIFQKEPRDGDMCIVPVWTDFCSGNEVDINKRREPDNGDQGTEVRLQREGESEGQAPSPDRVQPVASDPGGGEEAQG